MKGVKYPTKLTYQEAFVLGVAARLIEDNPAWTDEERALLESACEKLVFLENEEPQQDKGQG